MKRRLSDIEVPGIDSNQLERPKGQINGSSIFNRLLRTRDGLAVLIEVLAAPLMINGEEAMVEVGRDISDHERLGMYTVDPSNRLSSIFNSVQAGVLLIDRETHQIVDCEPHRRKDVRRPKGQIDRIGLSQFHMSR